jgi:SNF2 family DNA or RNA helicase
VKKNIFTLDSADWLEIPAVEYVQHSVELTMPEMDEYLRLNTMLNVRLDDEVVSFNEAQKFAKLQTLCNGFVYTDDGEAVRSVHSTKLDEVVDFVAQCAGEGERVLLFYAFKEEKAWLEEKLKREHIKFTDVKDKRFIEKWEAGDIDVLLAHPASAGHGLNLQAGGRMCVWSTIPYDYEIFSQANARLARQGQTRGVQIHSFIAAGTVEPKKFISLTEKSKILQEFIDLTK